MSHPHLTHVPPSPHTHVPPSPLIRPTLTSHTSHPHLSHVPPSPLTHVPPSHPHLSHTSHPHLSHMSHPHLTHIPSSQKAFADMKVPTEFPPTCASTGGQSSARPSTMPTPSVHSYGNGSSCSTCRDPFWSHRESVCLSVCLFICLSFCQSVCLSVCLSVFQFLEFSVNLFLSLPSVSALLVLWLIRLFPSLPAACRTVRAMVCDSSPPLAL